MSITQNQDKEPIDKEIERVLKVMSRMKPFTTEYKEASKNLKELYESKRINSDQGTKSDRTPSTDTIIIAVTNILGIVLILSYEHVHVITSRAINFVLKNRV